MAATRLEDLLRIEAIKQVKYRYVRALDTHDWDLMETCLTRDATLASDGGRYDKAGRQQIIELFQQLIGPSFISSHVVTHPEIELTGEGTALGRWRLVDTVHFTTANEVVASGAVAAGSELRGAAYYYDEYAVEDGAWKISHTGFTRIFKSVRPTDGSTLTIEPALGVQAGWPQR